MKKPVRNDDPGMRGPRARNEDGQLRRKRSDTHVRTIEECYMVDLGARGDKHLGTELRERGVRSLSELLKSLSK